MRYYSYNEYLKNKFGTKLYKLSLSISGSCPNRDGNRGVGGCIFCSAGGSGDFAAEIGKSLELQIQEAKERISKKYKGSKYTAYFQSFTSTYIAPQKLKEHLNCTIKMPDIAAVSVATRADCLGDEILDVLCECAKNKPLTVELGLQTVHDSTAHLINRCCELYEYENAIKKLKAIGAEVVLHIILGLPFETPEMMLQTVSFAAQSGADGVKLQLLYVLRGTRLCEMYNNGEFQTLEPEEYYELVGKALELLPPDMVICRLTGDGAKRDLVSPLWSADKKRVLNDLNRYLEENDIIQGRKYQKNSEV
ncbi:MAG: TIGR01212 family radical SAM protein [Oscillospiraceae bacterium]|nr:TIGR01212 family radical SAM protein [Oscillospiraceae bacterium]